ncbi:hypothetical protein MNBD_DELTA01-603 [hydrothermal vent metagenome]|uniref:Serine aminopeptidase S33 domain-containing protein n=1 Tax=hydrothermal vent metagenome TaxID=652676 RepID=A0A3B0QUA7_9ZZZZ
MKVTSRGKKIMGIALAALIIAPFLIYAVLYVLQERMIFVGALLNDQNLKLIRAKYPKAEELTIETPDGTKLHGWFLDNSPVYKSPLLIYFGGNNEEASNLLDSIGSLDGWSVLLVNYRGYGLSNGEPTEENLFKDSLFLYDTFSKRDDIDPNNIVAMGRSLGSGVAVYLANQRPLKAVMLTTPYDSIREVAQDRFPFVPVRRLLKHPFDSLALASTIKTPMIAFLATRDRTIKPEHSIRLIEGWAGTTDVIHIQDASHGNIVDHDEYWIGIRNYLDKTTETSTGVPAEAVGH